MTVKDLRTAPGRDGAVLRAEAASLRECAERLDSLAAGLPAQRMPDWADNVLMTLAERCRVAAADLETAAVVSDSGLDDDPRFFALPPKAPSLAGLPSLAGRAIPPIASMITRRTT